MVPQVVHLRILNAITIIRILKFVKDRMSPRRIQRFLLLGVCAITLHFTIRLAIDGASYFSLQKQGKAQISQWEIIPIKDQFAIKAKFEFEDKKKIWQGESTLKPPFYLNENAAISALKEKAKMNWVAWYSSKNPSVSALEKSFPWGLLVRVAICYGVIIYFICLYKRLSVV